MDEKQQALLAQALSKAANAILVVNRNGRMIWANQAFRRLCGYERDELIGQTPSILRSGMQSPEFYHALWQTISSGQVWQGELVERNKDGDLYTVHQVITPLLDETGEVAYFLAIQHNIAEQTQEHGTIKQQAFYDELTGLPNRTRFLELLHQAAGYASLGEQKFTLMLVNLDRFKSINDTLGHATGDMLLIAAGKRLAAALNKDDIVAHLSRDEFAVLVANINQIDEVNRIASKLLETLSSSFLLNKHTVNTSASIGICIYPRDGDSGGLLLSRADAAMHLVKACGGNSYGYWQDT